MQSQSEVISTNPLETMQFMIGELEKYRDHFKYRRVSAEVAARKWNNTLQDLANLVFDSKDQFEKISVKDKVKLALMFVDSVKEGFNQLSGDVLKLQKWSYLRDETCKFLENPTVMKELSEGNREIKEQHQAYLELKNPPPLPFFNRVRKGGIFGISLGIIAYPLYTAGLLTAASTLAMGAAAGAGVGMTVVALKEGCDRLRNFHR